MATKKTVKPVEPAEEEILEETEPAEEEILEETEPAEDLKEETEPAAEEQPKITDEWDETIEMIVPRKPKGEDQSYYICVNDRRFQIPANGKMQKLPKPIALILQDSLEMESEADDYADKLPKQDPMNAGTIV